MSRQPARFLLCADDFAITPEVSAGIAELAAARRISATSALVTHDAWSDAGETARRLRQSVAVGLHLNLTEGAPLGAMPKLAPNGFPSIGAVIARAVTLRIGRAEVAAEIHRQLDRFEEIAGASPDFIDGHQHVQVLPGVRAALASIIATRFAGKHVLVRDPTDRLSRLVQRVQASKAMVVATLGAGFARAMRRSGAEVNAGFSGFSAFDTAVPYAREFEAALRGHGARHLVMCHPGRAGAAPVTAEAARRAEEFDTLMAWPDLPERIAHPADARGADGSIDWRAVAYG